MAIHDVTTPAPDGDRDPFREAIFSLLRGTGEDIERGPLAELPGRLRAAFEELTSGYHRSVEEVVEGGLLPETGDDMVVVRDVEFQALSERDLLPFFGTMQVAFIPAGRSLELSRVPPLVSVFSRRLTTQERLTRDVANALNEVLRPKGVCIMTQARHLSVMMRGAERQYNAAICSCMLGDFRHKPKVRVELMGMLGSSFRV